MKRINVFLTSLFLMSSAFVLAQTQYTRVDSIRIMSLIAKARKQPANTNWMLFFGRQFKGFPYVGKTLDRNKTEMLVVNTRELDCTTFVEQVLALKLCMQHHKYTFQYFCDMLRHVRYKGGIVSFVNRQHYFTTWIEDNKREGLITDIQGPNPPFIAIQHLNINYMTTHVNSYAMLKANPKWLPIIRKEEKNLTGRRYRYIPKGKIANNKLFRSVIKDGDIIVILTKKKGLDTSHIGIAAWHKDGLHLLNASYLRKKVVEEPQTLYRYMQGQASQIGIRVCR